MKIEKSLTKLAEDLVAYGRERGADQVEVAITDSSEFNVDVLKGRVEKLTEAGSRTAALKVVKEERVMTATSSDLAAATLHGLMDRSIEKAALMNADPFGALPDLEPVTARGEALGIYDEAIPALTPEEKIERALRVEELALADPRVKNSNGASVNSGMTVRYLANSNGFSNAYRETGITCGVFLQAGEGDNLFDEGRYDFCRRLDGLMPVEEIAAEAVQRVTRLIGAQKIDSQVLPVVFERDRAAEILAFLSECVSGQNVFRQQSYLGGKIGEKIAGDNITVIDDGLMPGAPGTKPFDGEGVPARRTVVIENGVLKSYILDTYSARKLQMKSTGNGSGVNNFYLQPGEFSPEQIIASVEKGLLLTQFMAFGTETTTGNISKGAFGMLIEGGKVTRPVSEITIQSTLGEMLSNITMIGNDLKHDSDTVSPTFLVASVSIGGK